MIAVPQAAIDLAKRFEGFHRVPRADPGRAHPYGAGRLQTSTLRRRVNQRDWSGTATELRRWIYGGGKVLPGLLARRNAEVHLIDSA